MNIIRPSAISITLMFFSGMAWAGNQLVPVEGVSFQVNQSITENLKHLSGKKVSLYLDGGKIVTGRVKTLSENLLHIEKIQQKEFFDALIRVEKIQGIEVQYRQYQR